MFKLVWNKLKVFWCWINLHTFDLLDIKYTDTEIILVEKCFRCGLNNEYHIGD